jgi:hypothetical protein
MPPQSHSHSKIRNKKIEPFSWRLCCHLRAGRFVLVAATVRVPRSARAVFDSSAFQVVNVSRGGREDSSGVLREIVVKFAERGLARHSQQLIDWHTLRFFASRTTLTAARGSDTVGTNSSIARAQCTPDGRYAHKREGWRNSVPLLHWVSVIPCKSNTPVVAWKI